MKNPESPLDKVRRDGLTPAEVHEALQEGNQRFQAAGQVTRDFRQQIDATSAGQFPMAAVLGCIDSRVPVELVFDLGIGDVFGVRVAGNVIGSKSLGSLEYAVVVAGVKLVVVLGHTRCGAVTSSIQLICAEKNVEQETNCRFLQPIVNEIGESLDRAQCSILERGDAEEIDRFVNEIARKNVERTANEIVARSDAIRAAVEGGQTKVVGAMYDVASGAVDFLPS